MTAMLALMLGCGGSQKPDPEAAGDASVSAGDAAKVEEPAPTPAPDEGRFSQVPPAMSRAAVSPDYSANATSFAMRFHEELADGNAATSGTSAQIALSMLALGAAGETREEFGTVFGVEMGDAWHVDMQRATAAYTDTPGVELTVANALWTQQGFGLKDGYVEKMRSGYLVDPAELDFAGDSAGAAGTINAWTNEKTTGMIEKLFDPGDVQGAKVVLANAIAFKGKWANAFDPELTKPMPFATPGGSADVPTMSAKIEGLSYVDGDGFTAVALPYQERGAMMIIVLPDEGTSIEAVEGKLDAAQLGRMTMSGRRPVNVSLPKWKAETKYDLVEALKALGLHSAFANGDFSAMSDQPLGIDTAIQKVFVEVDEEGTRAAAVTGVMVKTTALPPPPVDFVVNRPFFWAIWHTETQSPLFTGRVVDPR